VRRTILFVRESCVPFFDSSDVTVAPGAFGGIQVRNRL
jgi:hypothetical protein